MFTTLENTPIEIDLLVQGNSRGWFVEDGEAVHEACNSGPIELTGKSITAGEIWSFSYQIISFSGGSVQSFAGDTAGAIRTAIGNYSETLTVTGENPVLYFNATADNSCRIKLFSIQQVSQSVALKQDNTTAFSEKTNKWNPHYTYVPDIGFSLFTNLYTYKFGNLYAHKAELTPRNNFYGQQYQSILKPVFNLDKSQVKTFQSITLQSNQLMITTTDGIETSLGQVSELIEEDFLQETLIGVSNVEVYSKEGIFQAGFLRDKTEDINDGPVLKGNFIAVELITVDAGKLRLLTATVNSVPSKNGTRN